MGLTDTWVTWWRGEAAWPGVQLAREQVRMERLALRAPEAVLEGEGCLRVQDALWASRWGLRTPS